MEHIFAKDMVSDAQTVFTFRGGDNSYRGIRVLFTVGETQQLKSIIDNVVYGNTVIFRNNNIFVNGENMAVDTEVAVEAARLFGFVNRNNFGTY